MTAAHCVLSSTPQDLRVIVGEYDQAVNNEEYLPRRVVGVSMVLPHPYHDPYTMQHDIALIRLDQVLSLFIYSPACLSAPGVDTTGDTAWVYGKRHPPITLLSNFTPTCRPNSTLVGWSRS